MKSFPRRLAIPVTLGAFVSALAFQPWFLLIDVLHPLSQTDATIATVQAAWFQAIGSILAIGAAIWVGHASDVRARQLLHEDRHRQATIAASSLSLRLGQVASECRQKAYIIGTIRQAMEGEHDDQMVNLPADMPPLLDIFLLTPENLKAEFRAWTLLFDHDSGIKASIALDFIETYNFTIKGSVAFFLTTGTDVKGFKDLCATAIERLSGMEADIRDAAETLETNFGLKED